MYVGVQKTVTTKTYHCSSSFCSFDLNKFYRLNTLFILNNYCCLRTDGIGGRYLREIMTRATSTVLRGPSWSFWIRTPAGLCTGRTPAISWSSRTWTGWAQARGNGFSSTIPTPRFPCPDSLCTDNVQVGIVGAWTATRLTIILRRINMGILRKWSV